jgi:5-methylcytosine-specific restriction protein A
MVSIVDFRSELKAQFQRAERRGAPHVEINAGELHRQVGDYPGPSHRMPSCCEAMYDEKGNGDELITSPEGGKGAALTIRYKLPRGSDR